MIVINLSHIIILHFSRSNLMLLRSFNYYGSFPPSSLTLKFKDISFTHLINCPF